MPAVEISLDDVADKVKEGVEVAKDKIESALSSLSDTSREVLEGLSGKAKEFAGDIYESLDKAKEENRLIAKAEIAFDQVWVDKHGEKAAKWKEKVALEEVKIDLKDKEILSQKEKFKKNIELLDEIAKEHPKRVLQIEKQKLRLKTERNKQVQALERNKQEAQKKKEEYQLKLDVKEQKAKNWVEKRNLVAEKMINHYDEKLKPLEKDYQKIENAKKEQELVITIQEVRMDQRANRIANVEESLAELREEHQNKNLFQKIFKRNPSLSILADVIKDEKRELFKEQKRLFEMKEGTIKYNERLAKLNEKAAPFIRRRGEFDRVITGEDTYTKKLENKKLEKEAKYDFVKNVSNKLYNENTRKHHKKAPKYENPTTELVNLDTLLEDWIKDIKHFYKSSIEYDLWGGKLKKKRFYKVIGFNKEKGLTYEQFSKLASKYLEFII